jgi:hypothetical protein
LIDEAIALTGQRNWGGREVRSRSEVAKVVGWIRTGDPLVRPEHANVPNAPRTAADGVS